MKTIKLTGKHANGRAVIVDDEDYEELNKYKWEARPRSRKNDIVYAVRCTKIKDISIHWKKWKTIQIFMHRYLLKLPTNRENGLEGDHIDRDTLNNQKDNLRIVTHQQNILNKGKQIKGNSLYKGVYTEINKGVSYWTGSINLLDGTNIKKRFRTEVEAVVFYNKQVIKFHGEHGFINTITDEHIKEHEQILKYNEEIKDKKRCATCKEYKSKEVFGKNGRHLSSYCKGCMKERKSNECKNRK